jgi:hypothetical protein
MSDWHSKEIWGFKTEIKLDDQLASQKNYQLLPLACGVNSKVISTCAITTAMLIAQVR